jgi:hypothetical protein
LHPINGGFLVFKKSGIRQDLLGRVFPGRIGFVVAFNNLRSRKWCTSNLGGMTERDSFKNEH